MRWKFIALRRSESKENNSSQQSDTANLLNSVLLHRTRAKIDSRKNERDDAGCGIIIPPKILFYHQRNVQGENLTLNEKPKPTPKPEFS